MNPQFSPPLPAKRIEPCKLCGGPGLVVRDLRFLACLCERGRLPGVGAWVGMRVHPEDLVV